tara:strand:+ start:70 stop:582 length:513 start_codon:yes stop_codon:yes gene_type:complete
MKKLIFIFVLMLFQSCAKQKTILICGDHVCVNKAEAKQFFEENLTLEVKIIDKKDNKEINLVQLNLNEGSNLRQVNVVKKKETKNQIRVLTNKEVKEIKKKVKTNKNKYAKKIILKDQKRRKNIFFKKNNSKNDIVDICNIVNKCTIDEISKYLIKTGKKKDFPDITVRE